MNKAVFLDKDGTIIKDVGYLDDPKKVRLFAGSASAIRSLNKKGFKVIVISNQSGIARGMFTESTLKDIDDKLISLIKRKGGKIDGIYYCPHHPRYGLSRYRRVCECRKPHNGLIIKAAKEHRIDLKRSFTVGDKRSDIKAGKISRTRTILVLSGEGRKNRSLIKPDHIALDLPGAVKWILKEANIDRR
jgi:D-glycero-D-manno-heptose 1,7-bisphosphate phosphatase